MASEEKKTISFGFNKQLKKPNIFNANIKQNFTKQNIQLIDCVESNSIKVIGGEESKEKAPLVIPLIKQKNETKTNDHNKKENQNEETNENKVLTLDEIAAQELINESKNIAVKTQSKLLTISTLTENGVISGEPEPTLDDYENIPINEFGKAMLRGMGWEEQDTNKNKNVTSVLVPRPKGMGLGADKLATEQQTQQTVSNENGEELKLIKGAYVRIISGRDKNKFGQVQGFDDDSGAVIVKLALDGSVKSYQEFLVSPVTKEEYGKNAKVLNLQKYEDYSKKDQSEAGDERTFSNKESYHGEHHSEKNDDKEKVRETESTSSRHRKEYTNKNDYEYKSDRRKHDRYDNRRYDSERSSRRTDRSNSSEEDNSSRNRRRNEKYKKQLKQEYEDSDYESKSRKVMQDDSSDDTKYDSKNQKSSNRSSKHKKHKRDSYDDRQKHKSKKKHKSRSRSRSKHRKK